MSRHPFRALVIALLASLCVAVVACGDEDEPHEEEHGGGTPNSASCVEISDACHNVDMGTGTPHECHELAHHDVEADCADMKDECLAACVPM